MISHNNYDIWLVIFEKKERYFSKTEINYIKLQGYPTQRVLKGRDLWPIYD